MARGADLVVEPWRGWCSLVELHPEWESILRREAPELVLNPVDTADIPF